MPQEDLPSTTMSADIQARFDQGMRDGAQSFTPWQAARGVASSFTLTFLAASAFFPLLTPAAVGGTSSSAVLTWLAGLGCNALAGWLGAWSEREIKKLASEDKAQQQALIEQLAEDLQHHLARDETLREDIGNLLDQTDGISTAINSLALDTNAQTSLIEALRADIRQSNLIQGRLHQLLARQLGNAETQIITAIALEGSFTREEVRLQAEETHARLDILPTMYTTQNSIQATLNSILRRLPSEETPGSSGVKSAVDTQIDIARALAQKGHFIAARTILIEVQAQFGENEIRPESQARVANLLGCCAFAMDELQVAQTYFDQAMSLTPNNVGMLTNCAMVALLSDRPEAALELSTKARNLDRKDPNASCVYIQALHRVGQQKELEEALKNEPWITDTAVGAAALASIKYELEEYEEAEALLRHAITLDPTDPQLYVLLANRILTPLSTEFAEVAVLNEQFSIQLDEAEKAFSQAIMLYEHGGSRASLQAARVSRAGIRCAQGKLEAGLADCERVLSEDTLNRGALENKGRILLNLGRVGEAILCFEEILSRPIEEVIKPSRYKINFIGGRKTNIPALLASAYIDIGQFNKVTDLLSPLFIPAPDDRDQLDIAEALLIAQSRSYDKAAVANTLKIIDQTWPQNPEAKAIIAGHHARQGNHSEAINLLREGAGLAEGFLRSSFIAKIAYLLYQERQYAEAANTLQPIIEKTHDNPDLRLYIACLYNSQQLGEALPLAQFIRSTTGIIPEVAEIEALILQKGGDVVQASVIWQQLIQAEPANISHRVNAAYTEWRAGNREAAKRLTLEIPYDTVKNNAILLINIARLRAFLKLSDVLAFAYQARRIAFHNPDVHVQYMMLCLNIEEIDPSNARLIPSQVEIDTVVHLVRNGKTTTFLIVDDEVIQNQLNELHVRDPLVQKLLGRRIGDHIALQSGFLDEPEHEITEIQSKYIYASHQTTNLFAQGSLRHQAFYAGDVTESDFIERFTRFLDQRAQFQPDIQALYTQQGIPLSSFAHMIGRSIIDVWLAFVESPSERIFSAIGTTVEEVAQSQILAASTSVVIDLLSLLTIVHISLEETIAQRFDAILMPQALLDQLHDYEQELAGPQPSGTIGSFGGQRHFIEIPPEYVERKRDLLNKMLAFVRSTVQVYPTMGIIEADQKIVEIVGEAATACILLAKEREIALYSDDLRIRMLANEHWKVQGFDSQTVLKDVQNRAIVSDDRYYNALSRLAQSNYHFIRVDAKTLVFILEQNRMTITEEVHNLFKLLHGPDCNPESAAFVIAELIKNIWTRQMLDHQRLFILDLALRTLFTGRRPDEVIPTLKRQLWQKFRLINFMLPQIMAHIDYWQQQPL